MAEKQKSGLDRLYEITAEPENTFMFTRRELEDIRAFLSQQTAALQRDLDAHKVLRAALNEYRDYDLGLMVLVEPIANYMPWQISEIGQRVRHSLEAKINRGD